MEKIIFMNKFIPKQIPEKYYGNKEYKLNILLQNRKKIKKSKKKFYETLEKRATQMLFRIIEGNGKAIYLIGLNDNGETIGISKNDLFTSIENLEIMCEKINAKIKSIRIYNGLEGYIGSVRIIMDKEFIKSKNINIF